MSLSRRLASSLAGIRWTTAMTTRMAVYALPCVLRRVGEGYFFSSAQVGCRWRCGRAMRTARAEPASSAHRMSAARCSMPSWRPVKATTTPRPRREPSLRFSMLQRQAAPGRSLSDLAQNMQAAQTSCVPCCTSALRSRPRGSAPWPTRPCSWTSILGCPMDIRTCSRTTRARRPRSARPPPRKRTRSTSQTPTLSRAGQWQQRYQERAHCLLATGQSHFSGTRNLQR
mmetsp:Transcript_16756/g.43259  ORF Transcript_16756/g.43259 Transcript_16756/m.43259 type:complete len:228 (-) Transcript_16756:227-910(-)